MTATGEKQNTKIPVEEIWGGAKLKIFFYPKDIIIITF